MVFSLVNWYIVDQRTAGVIVILWLFIFFQYYFIRFPRLIPVVLIAVITQILIIGYELQVRRLGEAAAAASGQPYYPYVLHMISLVIGFKCSHTLYRTDLLAPYRLAVVAGGSFVAFFWTIFPAPLTDRSWLRRDLSAILHLLGGYFSMTVSALKSQKKSMSGHIESESATTYRSYKARRRAFGGGMRLLSSMQSHLEWQRWEPRVGGRFPVDTYRDIITRIERILGYLIILSYATERHSYTDDKETGSNGACYEQVAAASKPTVGNQHGQDAAMSALFQSTDLALHSVLSAMSLMSNSMLSGQALPPFLTLPQSYAVSLPSIQRPHEQAFSAPNEREQTPLEVPFPQSDSNVTGLRIIDLRHNALGPAPESSKEPATDGDTASVTYHLLQGFHGLAEDRYFMMRLCSTLICDDVEGLMRAVSRLVGVVDFSLGHTGVNAGAGDCVTPNTGPMSQQPGPTNDAGRKGKAKEH